MATVRRPVPRIGRFALALFAVVAAFAACADGAPSAAAPSAGAPSSRRPHPPSCIGRRKSPPRPRRGDRPIPSPPGLVRREPARSLLILLHGYSGSGRGRRRSSSRRPPMRAALVSAYPDGSIDVGNRFWNAPMPPATSTGVDDVGYLTVSSTRSRPSSNRPADLVFGTRAWLHGHRLACEEASVAAIVSVAGATDADPSRLCAERRPCSSSRSTGRQTTSSSTKAATSGRIRRFASPVPGRGNDGGETWAAYDAAKEASTPLDEKVMSTRADERRLAWPDIGGGVERCTLGAVHQALDHPRRPGTATVSVVLRRHRSWASSSTMSEARSEATPSQAEGRPASCCC